MRCRIMNRQDIISSILNYYKEYNFNFDVYIVADTLGYTKKTYPRNINHADDSEFFSRTEFAEIASAIFYSFGYVRVFYSELEFIQYIINNNINTSECIVYNFARDGRANGKKSLIPAFCDLLNIKYTGSDAFVISLLRNKFVYTEFLEKGGIPVPKSKTYSKTDDYRQFINYFEDDVVIVKNKYESASIGLSSDNIFHFQSDSDRKLSALMHTMYTDSLLIQEYIDGQECEVLVLQYNGIYYALDPVEIIFKASTKFIDTATSNAYNYDFKVIESPLKERIQELAEKSAKLLGIKDYARFDFRIKNGEPYLFDIAGTPYTIYHSSIAHLFTKHYKLPYETIYKVIVTCMLSNYKI